MIVGKPPWNSYKNNEELRQAWADFIRRYKWDWFLSLTFEEIVHEDIGKTMFGSLVNKINKQVFGKGYYKRNQSVYWVRGKENHKQRKMYHFHALLGGLPDGAWILSPKEMEDWWCKKKKWGTAKIVQYDPERSAAYYIAKYIGKGGVIDVQGLSAQGYDLTGVQRIIARINGVESLYD